MKRKNRSIRAKPDRLSSLPDSLLSHILSFIPTQNSVLTSVLARRWRFLWRDVPNFDFNFAKYMKKRPRIRFEDTINRVLLLSNVQNINSFRLILEDQDVGSITMDRFILKSWIMTAIAKHVQALHIQLQFQIRIPGSLFTCETLVDLELHSLNLDVYDPDGDHQDWYINKLEINTPALRYLYVDNLLSKCISTGTFNYLVEANICLYDVTVPDDTYSNTVLELIEKVGQVKCLSLSIVYHQFPESSLAAATSKFSNLTKLELGADGVFLLKFLESAVNLQILIIKEAYNGDLKRWAEPQQVPSCLSSHLRLVTIHSFEYIEVEFEMVSYILRNGQVLEMMNIISRKNEYMMHINKKYTDLEEKFNAIQRISAFERRSETCKVQFS